MSMEALASDSQSTAGNCESLASAYARVRGFSEQIIAPLEVEDCVIQSMPDVSPTRWHLAHTTWFFETFFLKKRPGYRPFDEAFEYLFNSYYNTLGDQFPRARRGLLSRPTVDQVIQYRQYIDQQMMEVFDSGKVSDAELEVLEIGLNHEQQHQELMLTDIKHVLSCNPLNPVYMDAVLSTDQAAEELAFCGFDEGVREIGFVGEGFAYDNESPRHRQFLGAFEVADRLVTVGEYLDFIGDGGYRQPVWWLSLGWNSVQEGRWKAPLYWQQIDGQWYHFTMCGLQPLDPHSPVCHVSYFEADAYARWAGMRLASEAEWEVACCQVPLNGNFADHLMRDDLAIHPRAAGAKSRSEIGETSEKDGRSGARQMFGDVWEWTQSPYTAYPGYTAAEGALGEYNGKFMCGQFVLRGGSCATPSGHVRGTYRNFFPPDARWQFSGIRLARDLA